MSEEKRIMDFFGYSQIEGDVRGEHLGKILTFLKIYSGKSWDFVKEVSPLIIHMQFRYIKDNYVAGLIRLGIIKIYSEDNSYKYQWIGEKALNEKTVIPFTEPQKEMEKLRSPKQQAEEIAKELEKEETKEETEKEEKPKEGYCPNCGKKLKKDKKFCNKECLTEYYMKKKKGKK